MAEDEKALTNTVNELKVILDGSDSSQDAVLEALRKLQGTGDLPTKVLSATLIGKSVNRLAKDSSEEVKKLATDLVAQWRQMHRKRKSVSAGLGEGLSRTMSNLSDATETDSLRPAPSQDSLMDPSQSETAPAGSNTDAVPEKLTPQREKVWQKLKEAITSSDKLEVKEGSLDDDDDTKDPEVLAKEIEAALWKDLGEKTAEYMSQVRAILFNLRDKSNHQFKFKVSVGFIKPEACSKLTAADMASEEKNAQRKKDADDAMAAIDQDWAMKKGNIRISGMFTCGKCKGTQTTYFQMQTRSSDEPMTTFARCLTCGNRWKFC